MNELRSAAGETLEFEVGPVERDDPPKEIASSASGQITTVGNHGYSAEDHVRVEGHLGNPINGVWVVASVESPTQFTLAGVTTGRSGGRIGTVTRQVAIDLTLADTALVFTAKRHLQDADVAAFLVKGYPAPATGIAVNAPSTARKNMATVTIVASDTDDVVNSEDFYFDVQLTEPDDRVTRLDRGVWRVGAAVTRA